MSSSDWLPLPMPPAQPVADFPVTVAATAPATPYRGQLWLDTTGPALKVWDGAAWSITAAQTLSFRGSAGINIAANGNVTNRFAATGGVSITRRGVGDFAINIPSRSDDDVFTVEVGGDQLQWFQTALNANGMNIVVRDIGVIGQPLTDPTHLIITVTR